MGNQLKYWWVLTYLVEYSVGFPSYHVVDTNVQYEVIQRPFLCVPQNAFGEL